MRDEIRISIFIPCYNYQEYVGEAIDSALNQSRPADEIIVIDDGSTDGSRSVISRYGDRIRPIFKENEGVNATVNRGFAETVGDVVFFLDADDRLGPDALAEVAARYSGSVAKFQYDLGLIDAEGRSLDRKFCNFLPTYTAERVRIEFQKTGTYSWPVTSGNAYTRAFLARVMPMEPPVSHDGVLNTIAPLYGEVITIPKVLGCYRLHNRNMSKTGGQSNAPEFVKSIAIRHKEIAVLRQHAERRKIKLPDSNILDNELTFVGYRFMAKKLRQGYEGSDGDRTIALFWRAVRMILLSSKSLGAKVGEIGWYCCMLLSGRAMARAMIDFRFNRGRLKRKAFALVGMDRQQ